MLTRLKLKIKENKEYQLAGANSRAGLLKWFQIIMDKYPHWLHITPLLALKLSQDQPWKEEWAMKSWREELCNSCAIFANYQGSPPDHLALPPPALPPGLPRWHHRCPGKLGHLGISLSISSIALKKQRQSEFVATQANISSTPWCKSNISIKSMQPRTSLAFSKKINLSSKQTNGDRTRPWHRQTAA